MKVKPMINGIEVKVGQIWEDCDGRYSKITSIHTDGMFEDRDGVIYTQSGRAMGYSDNWDIVRLVNPCCFKAETTYGETPIPNQDLIRVNKATTQPKATFTESEINAKINQVIKDFDWQKAVSVYTALNWSWYSVGIPSVGDLVVSGIERMKEAVRIAIDDQEEGYVSSGGLIGRAYITDGELTVQLEMQVTEATSY